MYANASMALEGLRHKRTGNVLPTKNIARNTKLVYYADELIGLKLHQTVIATYHADGVRIDTRGPKSPHGQGWFTNVTIDRLDTFTPARFLRDRGLLYIVANPNYGSADWTAPARLYAHGCSLSCNGSLENGLEPAVERLIADAHRTWQRKSKNFAKRMTTYWRNGGKLMPCCQEDDSDAHLVSHLEANEPCLPWFGVEFGQMGREQNLVGDPLATKVEERIYERLRPLADVAIHNAAPDFPYPQNPKDPNWRR